MKRFFARGMVGAAGALVIGLAVTLGAARAADDKIYVMKITLPTLNDPTYQFAKNYAAAVERHSGGRIKPELYPASQLGSIPRQIEGTQFGSIQCAIIPPEFFVGVDGRFEVMAAPSQHHLVGLLLAQRAGIELTHVPYRGGGPAMADLIAGNVPLMILSITGVLPLLQSDAINVLTVFAPERIALLPDVPTIAEAGYPGIEASVWFGALVPRETPDPIRGRLLSAFRAAASASDVQEHFAKLGLQTTIRGPDEFRAIMKADFEKYDGVARALNLDLN